jgi:hypothetical protein
MTLLLRPVKTIVCCRYNLSINKDELKYVLVPIFVNVAGRFWPSFCNTIYGSRIFTISYRLFNYCLYSTYLFKL